MTPRFPSLDALGRDLLEVPLWRSVVSLTAPFALAAAFFVLASHEVWIAALACAMLLTFFTYGSISHDLVHRSLRLPRMVNDILLTVTELLAFRSGHAYRAAHLHHHAHALDADDVEGAAAGMSWYAAIADGTTLQLRLWRFAYRRGRDRRWLIGEAAAIAFLITASLVAIPWVIAPAIYAALMIAGSWIFPLMTSFIPHDPHGDSALTQTRLFRGRVISAIALEHLYHLEHHLYPQVPHHNWPELARRLDPHFAKAGVRPITLWF